MHDDAYTAYVWAVKNAAGMKGDSARVALAGESAGGRLAVSTAIRARDEKAQMPVHVLSVYPIAGTDTTTIVNAEIDPLLSEGETLAGLLREADVTVEQKTWNGVTHEFFGMAAVHDKAKAAQQWGGDALKKAFGM